MITYLGDGGDVVIPEGVTIIGGSAFNDCTGRSDRVKSVIIPKGVTEIRGWAFSSCGNLTSMIIPEGVSNNNW